MYQFLIKFQYFFMGSLHVFEKIEIQLRVDT